MSVLAPAGRRADCARVLDSGARPHRPRRERALRRAGLGGEPCVCLEVLDAWARDAGDERVLVAASRGPADRIARREWNAPDDEEQAGWVGYGPSLGAPGPPADGLAALLSLPGGLPDRLVATVAASRSGGAISPRLHAALFGRVAAALGGWLGQPELELGRRWATRGRCRATRSASCTRSFRSPGWSRSGLATSRQSGAPGSC